MMSNIIEFPKEKICFLDGELHEIHSMIIGNVLVSKEEKGGETIETYRVPLVSDARIPLRTVIGDEEKAFVILPENKHVDLNLLNTILHTFISYEKDKGLAVEVSLLMGKGVMFDDKTLDNVLPLSIERTDNDCRYELSYDCFHADVWEEETNIPCGLLKDLAVLQYFTRRQINIRWADDTQETDWMKTINASLKNIYIKGLLSGNNDEGTIYFDGVNAYLNTLEPHPVTREEFQSGFCEQIKICVKPVVTL